MISHFGEIPMFHGSCVAAQPSCCSSMCSQSMAKKSAATSLAKEMHVLGGQPPENVWFNGENGGIFMGQ